MDDNNKRIAFDDIVKHFKTASFSELTKLHIELGLILESKKETAKEDFLKEMEDLAQQRGIDFNSVISSKANKNRREDIIKTVKTIKRQIPEYNPEWKRSITKGEFKETISRYWDKVRRNYF